MRRSLCISWIQGKILSLLARFIFFNFFFRSVVSPSALYAAVECISIQLHCDFIYTPALGLESCTHAFSLSQTLAQDLAHQVRNGMQRRLNVALVFI